MIKEFVIIIVLLLISILYGVFIYSLYAIDQSLILADKIKTFNFKNFFINTVVYMKRLF